MAPSAVEVEVSQPCRFASARCAPILTTLPRLSDISRASSHVLRSEHQAVIVGDQPLATIQAIKYTHRTVQYSAVLCRAMLSRQAILPVRSPMTGPGQAFLGR